MEFKYKNSRFNKKYVRSDMNYEFQNMTLKVRAVNRLGPSGSLTPLRCGFQFIETGHTDRNFLTHEYAMVYVLSGEGYYEDEIYGRVDVKPGCFIQRFPGVLHTLTLSGPRACFYLAVPGETVELFKITDALASESPVIYVGLLEDIAEDFQNLMDEMQTKKEEELMSVLLSAQRCILKFHQSARRVINPEDQEMERAMKLLGENLDQKIRLQDVAEKLNISYPSFRLRFTSYTGMPPGDFRIKKRIEKGRELLNSGCNVKHTSNILGYPDSFTFSRQFKRVTGISPMKYIKLTS